MHSGHTIDELINLVRQITTYNGNHTGAAHDHTEPNHAERIPASRSPQAARTAEPAWLAVFL